MKHVQLVNPHLVTAKIFNKPEHQVNWLVRHMGKFIEVGKGRLVEFRMAHKDGPYTLLFSMQKL
jgi:hypothetical protein